MWSDLGQLNPKIILNHKPCGALVRSPEIAFSFPRAPVTGTMKLLDQLDQTSRSFFQKAIRHLTRPAKTKDTNTLQFERGLIVTYCYKSDSMALFPSARLNPIQYTLIPFSLSFSPLQLQ